MKEIMTAASNGELTAEEKVDGQNLISYRYSSIPEDERARQKARGARNKGNLNQGGLDATWSSSKVCWTRRTY